MHNEATQGTEANNNPTSTAGEGSSTGSSPQGGVQTSAPKYNPWAGETERNTAQGPVKATPIKPTTPDAPASQTPPVNPPPPAKIDAPVTPVEGQPQTPPVNQQQQTPPATGQSLDPKALAKEFAAELRNLQTPQDQQPQGVSDEEYNKMFGVVQLNEQDFASIIGFAPEKPEQVAALNDVLQRLNRQSVRMANYMAQQQIKELESRLSAQVAPLAQKTQQEVEERIQTEFFGTYPGLRDYVPLLQEIREGILARKQTFNSAKELIDFVAQKASILTGKPVESFKTAPRQAAGTTTPQTAGASRQMTSTSVGGRVGGQTSGATTKPKTTAEALFSDEG